MSPGLKFSIHRYAFDDQLLDTIDSIYYLKDNWPIIYILSNSAKKSLYVGETSDFYTRMVTHLRTADKKEMSTIHIIFSDSFNKSATLDIESNLIKYISADEYPAGEEELTKSWKLLNSNIGLSKHNYYQKSDIYWQLFNDIWEKLRSEPEPGRIAFQAISYIDNSDLFKYSPFRSLNSEQYRGLFHIMEALLNSNTKTIIAEGGAGTGKSLLAIHLFKLLMTDMGEFNYRYFGNEEPLFIELVRALKNKYENPKLALVIPMTSFRETVMKVFRKVKGLRPSMVISPAEVKKVHYDIILVDEAHRLRRGRNLGSYIGAFNNTSRVLNFDRDKHTELDWVKLKSDKLIMFYDEKQTIKPSDVRSNDFKELKSIESTEVQSLKKQMRVLGGERYIKFSTMLLDCALPPGTEKYRSRKYECLLFDSVTQMRREIQQRDSETGLSRMVAGYSWEWRSKKNPELFDIFLENEWYRWNSITADWINSENAPDEIGCIHTTQGYDLNYAGIIFGREITYDKEKNEMVIIRDNYCDTEGKRGVTDPEELKEYIINIYRIVMHRAIKGVYIYAYHPELREYFSQFIPKPGAESNVVPL
ncbi:DUF2075 domain-containing protein [Chitinophaga barathri]|uniref:DUF2075 domain-containing protein n=1 Tax=Chitinophaga barathri TaxID=1647451 RepID=A0A3N4MGR1_9BACT|nr:DUF2075 domain-containing protein [Chitinophaga barathri]RPD41206.1 DUF2075 domain-containing protein [Chitinophaga barathri]